MLSQIFEHSHNMLTYYLNREFFFVWYQICQIRIQLLNSNLHCPSFINKPAQGYACLLVKFRCCKLSFYWFILIFKQHLHGKYVVCSICFWFLHTLSCIWWSRWYLQFVRRAASTDIPAKLQLISADLQIIPANLL